MRRRNPKIQIPKSKSDDQFFFQSLDLGLFRVWDFGFLIFRLAFIFLALPTFAATNISTAADDLPQLRPPRAEIPPTFWERYGLWVIMGAVVFVALFGVAVWALTRPKPPVIVPP